MAGAPPLPERDQKRRERIRIREWERDSASDLGADAAGDMRPRSGGAASAPALETIFTSALQKLRRQEADRNQ
jgi:hypothetical protein